MLGEDDKHNELINKQQKGDFYSKYEEKLNFNSWVFLNGDHNVFWSIKIQIHNL